MRNGRTGLGLAIAVGLVGCGGGSSGNDAGTGGQGGGDMGAEALDAVGDGADGGAKSVCLPPLVPAPLAGDDACPAPMPAKADTFDKVLAKAGLVRCDLQFPNARMEKLIGKRAHDRMRLPWYDAVHNAPLRLPAFARETVKWIDDGLASPDAALAREIRVAAQRLGYDLGEVCPFPYGGDGPTGLSGAVAGFILATGGTPDMAALDADAADVAGPVQVAVARILGGILETVKARDAAMEKVPMDVRPLLYTSGPNQMGINWTGISSGLMSYFLDAGDGTTYDFKALYGAAARLALTIDASGIAALGGMPTGTFRQKTPVGTIVIGGSTDDAYEPAAGGDLDGDLLLVVDTGGNDTYRIPLGATRRLENPVSVAIDLGGDDLYTYPEAPDPNDAKNGARMPSDAAGRQGGGMSRSEVSRQGAGRAGVGLLIDLGGGSDEYRTLRGGQGFGLFGVGALFDDGGDDKYRAEAMAQGGGIYGVGLLYDRAGNDDYKNYAYALGFAYARGAGILADGGGDDRYESNNGDPDFGGDPVYPSGQAPGHANTSMSMGVGFGRRSDGNPAYDQSGGIGIFRDAGAGDDTYMCSTFCEGSGYWFGTGIFQDGGGNDAYDGFWYVLGANAHMAMTWFADEGGNDTYVLKLQPKATSIGVGHDLSACIHWDMGGNDHYRGAGLSLGAGYDNGLGILVNTGGDDLYEGAAGVGLGSTGGDTFTAVRSMEPTFGFFVDVGGDDKYMTKGGPMGAGNDAIWAGNFEMKYAESARKGAGGDEGAGTVTLP